MYIVPHFTIFYLVFYFVIVYYIYLKYFLRGKTMHKPELLAPAGDMNCLKAAARFGADAVYIGGPLLQLRAEKSAFTEEEIDTAAKYLHSLNKKLYVTVNSFTKNSEIEPLKNYARTLYSLGVDAVIVADLGALRAIKQAEPRLEVHISTQANCCNYSSAMAYYEMGASRIVVAREMTIDEIAEMHSQIPDDLEIEAFVHGAMCMAYSGRCLISSYMNGRSGNRGECTQPCRWEYYLVERNRPNEYMKLEEYPDHSALLSSHDMKAIGFFKFKNNFYIADETSLFKTNAQEPGNWSFTFTRSFDDSFDNKGINAMTIAGCSYFLIF